MEAETATGSHALDGQDLAVRDREAPADERLKP
jgi:hypothetical protein